MRRLITAALAGALLLIGVPDAVGAPPVPGERCSPTMKGRIVDVPGVGTLQCLKHWPKGPGIKRLMWLRIDSKITRRAAVVAAREHVRTKLVPALLCKKFLVNEGWAWTTLEDVASMEWSLGYPETAARWAAGVVVPETCGGQVPPHWWEWVERGDPNPPE